MDRQILINKTYKQLYKNKCLNKCKYKCDLIELIINADMITLQDLIDLDTCQSYKEREK